MNPRDAALAVGITSMCAAVAWVMVNSAPPPQVGTSTREVVVQVNPTRTVTATATVTARPTATRTVTVSRSRERGSVWDRLAQCESGGRWDYNGPSGYDGGLQFSPRYWPYMARIAGVTDAYAWQATRAEQIRVAEVILDRQGWQAWPVCSRKIGVR